MKPAFLSSALPWRQFQRKLASVTADLELAAALTTLLSFVRDGSDSPSPLLLPLT